MKINKLTIILIIIIILLLGYIGYDKLIKNNTNKEDYQNEKLELVDEINLEYLNIYLTSDGISYISPINKEKIESINGGENLKQRLNTLYERAFYYDIFIDNFRLKGFKINLDNKIKSIRKIEQDDNIYILFIKENNTIGLFNYDEYYNFMNTEVYDNYKNIENVLDIKDNKIIYLDGSKESINFEE